MEQRFQVLRVAAKNIENMVADNCIKEGFVEKKNQKAIYKNIRRRRWNWICQTITETGKHMTK